jgi:hypothetical protein
MLAFSAGGLAAPAEGFRKVEIVTEGNGLTGFFRTCNVFLMSFSDPGFWLLYGGGRSFLS